MKQIVEKYRAAIAAKPEIVCTKENVRGHPGNTEEDLLLVGLTQKDLLRLSRLGLAIKAYTQNIFFPEVDDKNWVEVSVTKRQVYVDSRGYERTSTYTDTEPKPLFTERGKGMRRRWILLQE